MSALAATAGGTLTSKQKIKLEAYIQMNLSLIHILFELQLTARHALAQLGIRTPVRVQLVNMYLSLIHIS